MGVINCDPTGLFPLFSRGDNPHRDCARLVPQGPKVRMHVDEKGWEKQGFHILRFSIGSCPRQAWLVLDPGPE